MPEEAHRIMAALRTQRDEELLDLVREAIEKLNVLGDRLEQYVAAENDNTPQIEEISDDADAGNS